MSSLPSGERRGPAAASPVRHARPRSPHPTRPRTPWRAAAKVPGSIRRGGGLGTPARAGRASRPDNYATAVPGLSIEKSTRYGGSIFGRTQYLGGAAFAAYRPYSPPVTRWKQAGSLKSPRPAGPVATCRSHPRRATRQGEAPESIAARRSRVVRPVGRSPLGLAGRAGVAVSGRPDGPRQTGHRPRARPGADRGRPTSRGRPSTCTHHSKTRRRLESDPRQGRRFYAA
jgi:hypothetical protein